MKLGELFKGINHSVYGDASIDVKDLKYDSRKVEKGDLFFCISGYSSDGHEYAGSAVEAGACAVVVTRLIEDLDTTQILVKNDREVMALCAARFFGYPAECMKMVGITGTNGKTTTTYMIKRIAAEAGIKSGLMGTIRNMIGGAGLETERTTPESIDLHRLLRRMLDEGCEMVVMEVSSHSLYLKRVFGIEFNVGIFSNLTQDHMDFHSSWEEYSKAKSMLFENSLISVINIDDDNAANMMAAAKSEIMRYSVTQPTQFTAKNVKAGKDGVTYDVEVDGRKLHIEVGIPGLFTVYNSLSAVVAAHALGIESYFIEQGLKKMKPVDGRLELLSTRGQDYSIILDYAHTPDSLENVLTAIRQFAPARVVTLFGCGGNRDATKRPKMGEIAGRLSDFVIITSDNPRYEEPSAILDQIEAGVKKAKTPYIRIENRREAMEYAMKNHKKGDTVLLAGKGHETYQEIRGVKHDFDEKVIVGEILDGMGIKEKEA